MPLLEQHSQIAHKVAEALPLSYRAHDDTHAIRHVEFLHNLAQPLALLGVVNLA